MDIGKRLTLLRTQAGITTNKLANLSGLSQSFVRAVELGEKGITVENLTLICDALHLSMRDFFDTPENGVSYADIDELTGLIRKLSVKQRQLLTDFLKTI